MSWLQREIRLYVVVPVLLFVVAGATFATKLYFTNITYNYQLQLPQGNATSTPLEYGSWPALENANFFAVVRGRLIDQKASFVEANVSDKQINVYIDGMIQKSVPILGVGREGSWWETPAGLYAIQGKEENHFSSFGKVYMPWSMPFDGNFFIHGWPYYPDGTSVSSAYSGGCIRLSSDDAKALFDLVKVGMPVLVYKKGFQPDNFRYQIADPIMTAQSFLVADAGSNFVLGEKSSNMPIPIASITKLVTALVAVEYMNIEHRIVVHPEDIVPTSVPRLKTEESYSLYNLLYLLLDESSNEAAEAIAHDLGRTHFVDLMNAKAKAIGMTATAFTDPAGRNEGNVASARDLFILAKYLLENRSFILGITQGKVDPKVYGNIAFQNVQNFNLFSGDPNFLGGKVGKSDAAKDTALAIINVPEGGTTREVAIILLGSDDYNADGAALRAWITQTYAAANN